MEGEKLFTKIMDGRIPEAPTKQQAMQVLWYLQMYASSKVSVSAGLGEGEPQKFDTRMGVFSIEDKNGNLETFLNKVDNGAAYTRNSTHLKEYQRMGEDYKPRGLDFNDRDTPLPNDLKTLLFARMVPQSDDMPTGIPKDEDGNEKKMLFIKMEEHGLGRKRDWPKHAVTTIPTLLGISKTADGTDNRERIPDELKKEYIKFVKQYAKATGDEKIIIRKMTGHISRKSTSPLLNGILTTGGIKTMRSSLRTMQDQLLVAMDSHTIDNKEFSDISKLIDDMGAMHDLRLRNHDHWKIRIGNEIIITADDQKDMIRTVEHREANPLKQDDAKEKLLSLLFSEPTGTNLDDPEKIFKNSSSFVEDYQRNMKLSSPLGDLSVDKGTVNKEHLLGYISQIVQPGIEQPEDHLRKLTVAIATLCDQSSLIGLGLAGGVFYANQNESVILREGAGDGARGAITIEMTDSGDPDITAVNVKVSCTYCCATVADINDPSSIIGLVGKNDKIPGDVQLASTVTLRMNNNTGVITSSIDNDIQYQGELLFYPRSIQ